MIVESLAAATARLNEARAARARLVVQQDRKRAEALARAHQAHEIPAIADADPIGRRHRPETK